MNIKKNKLHAFIYHLLKAFKKPHGSVKTPHLFGCSNRFGLLCRRNSGCFSCLGGLDQDREE